MVQRCLDTLIPASFPPCRVKTAQGALVQHVSLMICVFLLGCWAFFMARGWRQGYWRFFAIVYVIDATLLMFSINFQTYAQPCNSGNGQGIPTPGKKLCRAVADMQRWEVEKCALGTSNNVTICKNDTFLRGFQYSVIFEKHLDGPRSA